MVIKATLGLVAHEEIKCFKRLAVVVLPQATEPEIEIMKGTLSMDLPKNCWITVERS